MKNPLPTRSNVARTALSLGLSWVLAWGGLPVPALAAMVGEELEVQADSVDAADVLDVDAQDDESLAVEEAAASATIAEVSAAEEPEVEEDLQVAQDAQDAIAVASDEGAIEEGSVDAGDDADVSPDMVVLEVESDGSDESEESVVEGAKTLATLSVDDPYGLSAEELLNGYAQRRIDETLPGGAQEADALTSQSAREQLNDANKAIYDYLKSLLAEVAAGKRTSTEFTVPFSVVESFYDGPWTAEQLGVSAIYKNGLTSEAMDAADAKLGSLDVSKVVSALVADCPYELYWYDKTTGPVVMLPLFSYKYSVDRSRTYKIGFDTSASFTLAFNVSADYSSTGKKYTSTMKSGIASKISTALTTAQNIVTQNKSKKPYAMLKAFKDSICNLVSYDYDTYNAGNVAYGNPWQLINVFDNDKNTKVVCEGYAKAFKYLCDLAGLSDVECIIATGTMSGGTGAGAHMWNIVKMDDEKNYLVDVTNSDSGTVGYEDYLFLVPAASGSLTAGYSFTTSVATPITYKYDATTTKNHASSALTILKTVYVAPTPRTSISSATVTVSGSYTYTGNAQCPDPVVKLGTKTLKLGQDYTVAYSPAQPINAGTVTVTVTGVNSYKDTATGTYTIARKSVKAPTAASGLTYNATTQVGVAEGEGYTLSGNPKATNVGTYSATATLASNYIWSDGTTNAKTITWTIGYAKATVTADDKSKVAGESDPTFTATVTGLQGSDKLSYTFSRATGDVAGKTYTITPTGNATQGNYSVTYKTGKLYVHQTAAWDISLATVTVTSDPGNLVYSGKNITAAVRVELYGAQLVQGTHYTVSGATAKDAGTYTITITGKDSAGLEGGYTGTKTVKFTIARQATVQVPEAVTGLTYSGAAKTGVKTGTGYVLSGTTSATNAGTYTAYATPDSNHAWSDGGTGAKTISWTIAPKAVTVTPQKASKTYGAADPSLYATTSGLVGTDKITYSVKRAAGEDVGTYAYTATATAKQGNYTVTCDNTKYAFTITPKQIDPPTAMGSLTYTGSSQTGVATGPGYKLTGVSTATNAGTYYAYAEPESNYAWTGGSTSSKTLKWTIAPASISTVTISLSATSFAYDGQTKQPTVSVKLGTKALALDTAYTISGTQSATKVGSYSLTVKGTGNYTGSVTKTWTITKVSQTITVPATSYNKTFGNAAFNLGAKLSNSELKLTYKSSATSVATVSSAGLVTIKGAGTTIITISQAGNANYSAATAKNVTVTVAQAANPLTATYKNATISKNYSASKSIDVAANVKCSNAQGTVTYTNVSTNATAKKFTVVKSSGKVMIPAGTQAGTYPVIVRATAAGNAKYKSGYKNVSYKITIAKIANTMKVKVATSTQKVSVSTLKSKAVTYSPLTVTGAQGTVSYTLTGGSGNLSISKTGVVTVKRGTAKGTYKASIKVTCAGNANYNSATQTKSVTVKVS